jgi:branched-chain amino acid transport system substrate-binding protein
LDLKAVDYSQVLVKIRSLSPDALYYGGTLQAGVKLARQAYEIIPSLIKAGGDGMYGPELLTAVGFPAAAGWYVTNAPPHVIADGKSSDWVKMFTDRFGTPPNDYAITAYDAALVVIDAARRAAAGGSPPTRDAVRDAIQSTRLDTLQGPITFDVNGDLTSKAVSVFQVRRDPGYPADDMTHQFKYIGVAPQS